MPLIHDEMKAARSVGPADAISMIRSVAAFENNANRYIRELIPLAQEARRKVFEPPEPGMESWPVTFPQDHLSLEAWQIVWSLVSEIRGGDQEVYGQFLYERTIAEVVVDFLGTAEGDISVSRLLAELRSRAEDQESWLINVPLVNFQLPKPHVVIGDRCILSRTHVEFPSDPPQYVNEVDPFAVKRHLGDAIRPRPQWLRASMLSRVPIDTRATASLAIVANGTEELAATVARTEARLMLSFWCLLKPPQRSKRSRPMWPTVGGWGPQPNIELGTQRKPFDPEGSRRRSSQRGASITQFGPYVMTRSQSQLKAPAIALSLARAGNQCALSLLSASRALYNAERFPSDLERSEKIVEVWRARDALCDPGRRGQGSVDQRWKSLIRRLKIEAFLRESGYAQTEIEAALDLTYAVRNLSVHRADDVLVNLSYPPAMITRLNDQKDRSGHDLALAAIAADAPIVLMAVRRATRAMARSAIANNWDERKFHAYFSS